MTIWKKGSGVQFENSAVCRGEVFVPAEAALDLAIVEVDGRYPEAGYIYNEEAHEMAYVAEGSGLFKVKGAVWQKISVGDVMYAKPGERFAWKSDGMKLVMPCSPQFDPAKHHEEEEER